MKIKIYHWIANNKPVIICVREMRFVKFFFVHWDCVLWRLPMIRKIKHSHVSLTLSFYLSAFLLKVSTKIIYAFHLTQKILLFTLAIWPYFLYFWNTINKWNGSSYLVCLVLIFPSNQKKKKNAHMKKKTLGQNDEVSSKVINFRSNGKTGV